ncbi:MAG: hypothetical protein V1859_06515 [archaeon]
MINAKCKLCGKQIPTFVRADAIYCSCYCRKLSYDIRHGRCGKKEQKKCVEGVGTT